MTGDMVVDSAGLGHTVEREQGVLHYRVHYPRGSMFGGPFDTGPIQHGFDVPITRERLRIRRVLAWSVTDGDRIPDERITEEDLREYEAYEAVRALGFKAMKQFAASRRRHV